jgi:putative membrane protein
MAQFLLRAALTGLSLWIVTLVVKGMYFIGGDSTLERVGIIFVVAVVFGLVNAVIKPIVQLISIPLYILTLGLIHIVINALMLWITSWITGFWGWGLALGGFGWTIVAALLIAVINAVFNAILRPQRKRDRDR